MSDVNHEQARLLFSCKRESPSQVTSVFTETEMEFVEDKTGLLVTAFDRAGRSYNLTCKYLVSNTGYRFITGWKAYVNDNGLGVAMRVELWSFRSRKLHNRYDELRQGKDGKEKKVPVMVESGHLMAPWAWSCCNMRTTCWSRNKPLTTNPTRRRRSRRRRQGT